MNQQLTGNSTLETTIMALRQLSLSSRDAVTALIRQLASREGIDMPLTAASGLQSPIEGVPLSSSLPLPTQAIFSYEANLLPDKAIVNT